MDSAALLLHRLHFGFTITFHYLFPQLTMGLAPLIVALQTMAVRRKNALYGEAARFWAKVFGINFVLGVVTGIPMEFQFGTNWSRFSRLTGGVIGQPLVMEGVFSFFLESAFLGLFLFGEKRLGPVLHWLSGVAVFLGSWLSGFFIIATNAWMQHPVAYSGAGDKVQLDSFWGLITNPWVRWQYLQNMSGAAITGAFVLAAMGAFFLLTDRHHRFARLSIRVGVVGALIFCVLQIFPTGDRAAHDVAVYQPSTFAAMEGLFRTEKGAPLVIIGNPNTEKRRLDSSLGLPHFLSFLTSRRWNSTTRGLNAIPTRDWPSSVPLVYYAYHIMVGLGTILLLIAVLGVLLLWRGRLYSTRPMLWALMLAFPFTYIANIAGWTTAETGRQPW